MFRLRDSIAHFIRTEAASGLLLLASAGLALIAANSAFEGLYTAFLDLPVGVRVGTLELEKPLLLWINDGLMAIFFLLVGLEIKRELLEGELSTREQAMLPCLGALGGMLVPALVYAAVNWSDPVALHGWAIPAATDIAFALGVVALLGNRVPASLKVFLVALAIIDDLGAIVIIALFYSGELSLWSLGLAAGVLFGLLMLNRLGVTRIAPYMLLGIALWLFVLKSGVHATLAGVAVAFAIPIAENGTGRSPLASLESVLHPWVAFLVMPAFAFANAGVSFAGITPAQLFAGVPLGIALGLFVGKPIGAFGAAWLAIRAGWARMPEDADWGLLYGICMLAGIGFTMSLFIGTLAFEPTSYAPPVRLGVLAGSVLSGISGFIVLRALSSRPILARSGD
ncbi:MAG TPA: Na+/H+ antiporter NhaA [Alphaproteobacteria bacterium]|nr:Na+/H+ antiporter NhaA [Alphaproteobacteria bacterium]